MLRAILEKRWGRIRHPTIEDLVLMVLRVWDANGGDITLWKMDLAGAFNLMDLDPDFARLLAFELTEGMTAMHLTGMFGWAGCPHCFQVISRVLRDVIRPLIKGKQAWFVDDGMAATPTSALAEDRDCDHPRAPRSQVSCTPQDGVRPQDRVYRLAHRAGVHDHYSLGPQHAQGDLLLLLRGHRCGGRAARARSRSSEWRRWQRAMRCWHLR